MNFLLDSVGKTVYSALKSTDALIAEFAAVGGSAWNRDGSSGELSSENTVGGEARSSLARNWL